MQKINNISKIAQVILVYIFILPLLSSNSIWGKIPISSVMSLLLIILYLFKNLKNKVMYKIKSVDILIMLFITMSFFSTITADDKMIAIMSIFSLGIQLCLYICIRIEFKGEKILYVYKTLVYSSLMTAIINIYQVMMSMKLYGYKSNAIFSNINYYATITVFIIPIAIALYRCTKQKRYLIIISVNSIVTLLSFSKGAIMLLIIYIISYFIMMYKKKNGILKQLRYLVILLVGVGITLFIFSKLNENMGGQYDRMMNSFKDGSSFSSRSVLNKVSMRMIKDNPLLGVGMGNYPNETYKYQEMYYMYHPGTQAHNIVFSTYAEIGVIGGTILLCLLIVPLLKTFKYRNIDIGLFWGGVVVSLLSYGMGLESWYLWIGLAVTSNKENGNNEKDKKLYSK